MVRPPRRTKEEIKHAILQATRDIASSYGWHAVTIRRVADCVGYTPPIVYEFFTSKDALLGTLALEGSATLLADMQKEAAANKDPFAAIATAYWRFSQMHPALYSLMFESGGAHCPFTDQVEAGSMAIQRYCHRLLGTVVGDASKEALEELFLTGWALLHGIVSLHKNNVFAGGRRQAEALMYRQLQQLSQAYKHSKEN